MNQEEMQEQLKMQQQIAMLEMMAKQNMSKEAISRYGNLKAAHPELALQVIAFIAQGVQTGKLKEIISDEELKNILMSVQQPKKEFKVTRR